MKKLYVILAVGMLFVFAGSAFAHGHHGGGGHYWRSNGNGGYYCGAGNGHGSHCRY